MHEIYRINTEDGLVEVEELDNGIKMETLIEPSEAYLQRLAEQPGPPPPEPNQDDYLLDLDFRICMIELGL
ncbi:hypothetical protein [Desulfosporosinus sp.]|uniref:hypothetical protein n=1 Tax=Desulfosporosinus sp. TaxID=157907 RepID=UPI0025C15E7B|nr:hypothetical protein [Desulfosporosinus sp.]MBC2721846.1 hypothetical protein [Desulfosporosinus sp.]MBC2726250.1 hypothetical protein [Desulfosporosinus sp.]